MTPTPSMSPTLQSSFLILDIGHKSDMEQIIKCMGKKNQNLQHSITGCHLLPCYIPSTWSLGFLLGHHTGVSMWLVLFTSKGKVLASLSKSNRSPDALRHIVVNCTKETAAHSTVRWLLAHRERQTHAPPASGHLNTCFAQPSTSLVHSDLGLCRGHTKKDTVLFDSDECIALEGNGRSINLSLDHSVPSHTLRSIWLLIWPKWSASWRWHFGDTFLPVPGALMGHHCTPYSHI